MRRIVNGVQRYMVCFVTPSRPDANCIRAAMDSFAHLYNSCSTGETKQTHSHSNNQIKQEKWNFAQYTHMYVCIYFGPFVVMLRSVWDHVGLFGDHVGIMLASIWDNFEVMLGSVWDQWEKSVSRASYKRLVLRSVRRPLPPFASWSRKAFRKRRHSTIFH